MHESNARYFAQRLSSSNRCQKQINSLSAFIRWEIRTSIDDLVSIGIKPLNGNQISREGKKRLRKKIKKNEKGGGGQTSKWKRSSAHELNICHLLDNNEKKNIHGSRVIGEVVTFWYFSHSFEVATTNKR